MARLASDRRTSSRRSDEKHADFLSRGRGSRAGGALLEALDARVEAANDVLQLLELIFNEAHLDGIVAVKRNVDRGKFERGSGKPFGGCFSASVLKYGRGIGNEGHNGRLRRSCLARRTRGVELLGSRMVQRREEVRKARGLSAHAPTHQRATVTPESFAARLACWLALGRPGAASAPLGKGQIERKRISLQAPSERVP